MEYLQWHILSCWSVELRCSAKSPLCLVLILYETTTQPCSNILGHYCSNLKLHDQFLSVLVLFLWMLEFGAMWRRVVSCLLSCVSSFSFLSFSMSVIKFALSYSWVKVNTNCIVTLRSMVLVILQTDHGLNFFLFDKLQCMASNLFYSHLLLPYGRSSPPRHADSPTPIMPSLVP